MTGTEPAKRGRPSTYTPELGDRICELHAGGTMIDKICADHDWAPNSMATVLNWAEDIPDFQAKYARAHKACAQALAFRAITVSEIERDPMRARVISENLRWLASKFDPGKFGDKLEIQADHTISLSGAIEEAQRRVIEGVAIDMAAAAGSSVQRIRGVLSDDERWPWPRPAEMVPAEPLPDFFD
jgi:hypothetical protein